MRGLRGDHAALAVSNEHDRVGGAGPGAAQRFGDGFLPRGDVAAEDVDVGTEVVERGVGAARSVPDLGTGDVDDVRLAAVGVGDHPYVDLIRRSGVCQSVAVVQAVHQVPEPVREVRRPGVARVDARVGDGGVAVGVQLADEVGGGGYVAFEQAGQPGDQAGAGADEVVDEAGVVGDEALVVELPAQAEVHGRGTAGDQQQRQPDHHPRRGEVSGGPADVVEQLRLCGVGEPVRVGDHPQRDGPFGVPDAERGQPAAPVQRPEQRFDEPGRPGRVEDGRGGQVGVGEDRVAFDADLSEGGREVVAADGEGVQVFQLGVRAAGPAAHVQVTAVHCGPPPVRRSPAPAIPRCRAGRPVPARPSAARFRRVSGGCRPSRAR